MILATTFGGSVFSWSSASEIALWVIAGVLSLVFGLTQTFSPLVDVEYKLYPTTFLQRPVIVMLQIAIFMSSASLLVSHTIFFFGYLRKTALNAVLDPGILHSALLPIHSGTLLPLNPVQLRHRQYSGFLSPRLCGPPPPLYNHGGHVLPREWILDGEAWLLHAVVSIWRRSRAHRLCSHVYVSFCLVCPKNSTLQVTQQSRYCYRNDFDLSRLCIHSPNGDGLRLLLVSWLRGNAGVSEARGDC